MVLIHLGVTATGWEWGCRTCQTHRFSERRPGQSLENGLLTHRCLQCSLPPFQTTGTQADCKGRGHSGTTFQSFCHSLGEPQEQSDFEEVKQDNPSLGPRTRSTSTLQEGGGVTCHYPPPCCLPTGAVFPSVVDTQIPCQHPDMPTC